MDKSHDIRSVSISGSILHLDVDGKVYEIDLARHSESLARATRQQRERIEVSPSGYGFHWPDLDEDLSIDGLIGVKHSSPLAATKA